MFWPYSTETKGKFLPKPWPYGTWVLMGLCLLIYVWSLFGRGTEALIEGAKEKVVCYFLQHDHLKIPASTLRQLPKALRRHYQRVRKVMEMYDRAPAIANAQGKRWLQEEDWNSGLDKDDDSDQSCMQRAMARGLFGSYPKRRLYMTLAQLSTLARERQQQTLNQLARAYEETRRRHPHYGWGLIGSEQRWFTFFSAAWLPLSWFALLWQLPLLWLLGFYLEKRWRGPHWLVLYVLAGLLAHVLLALLHSKSGQPMFGIGAGVAAGVGAWSAGYALRDVTLSYWKPGTPLPQQITFSGWYIPAGWGILALLTSLLFHPHPLSWLLAQLLCAGFGAGALWVLERFDVLLPQLEEEFQPPKIIKGSAFLKDTFSGGTTTGSHKKNPGSGSQRLTGIHRSKSKIAAEQARRQQLQKQADELFAKGDKEAAIDVYRSAMMAGNPSLWVLEGFLTTCEKAGVVAKTEEYLRGIRAAANEKQRDLAAQFFTYLMRHRSSGARTLTPREQLGLAADLKRAGLYHEALQELDDLLSSDEHSAFFIKASLLKAESLLQAGAAPQEAIFILNQAESALSQFPEFRDSLLRLRERAQIRLNALADAASDLPGDVADQRPPAAANDDPLSQPPPPATHRIIPQAISTAPEEAKEVDVSLLDEIDMFEALRQPQLQRDPKEADSWTELPSMLLYEEKKEEPADDIPSMFEQKKPTEGPQTTAVHDTRTAQEKLAEEVTAAFNISNLDLGGDGDDWLNDNWDAEEEESTSKPASTSASPHQPPPAFNPFINKEPPASAPPPTTDGSPFDPFSSGHQEEPLLLSEELEFDTQKSSSPSLQKSSSPPLHDAPPPEQYQASPPPLLPLDAPAPKLKELTETRSLPVVHLADVSTLLGTEDNGTTASYQATLPPRTSTAQPEVVDLSDHLEEKDPSKKSG